MPLIGGEGPVGLIVVPSRELAQQIFDVIQVVRETFVCGILIAIV